MGYHGDKYHKVDGELFRLDWGGLPLTFTRRIVFNHSSDNGLRHRSSGMHFFTASGKVR